MSDRIDQRIVEMSFENQKFEKGIHQSKNSLKEFSNALEDMGTGKDFSGLDNSVQSVAQHFSVLEQIGIGALRRIGEAAINAGSTLVKQLTVDQLSAGLGKYQQKIEAVQTMVSAGYGLDTVEKSMSQLLWFSDETSYSFADMAGSMAKFISAGVELKTAEKAIKGIATWAAHSGKNSTAASIAMFNLSQSISTGYVDTLNWRSIMNQNMNTTMFKKVAIDVAEATGAIKKGQVSIQNFDANLKTKWFTNDVLLKTLDQYSAYSEKVKEVQEGMNFDTASQAMDYMDAHSEKFKTVLSQIGNSAFKAAQESKSFTDSINATMDAVSTGWMRTYEVMFGTLDEAKANFSALSEVLWTVFASSADSRNEMLALIKTGGGIKKLFQILKNVSLAVLTPLRAISQALDQLFPPKTSKQWLNLIDLLETVSRKMIISEATAIKIKRTFAGFFAIIDIGWETFKFLGRALYEIINAFIPLNDELLNTTASIGDFLVKLNQIIKNSGIFQYGILGIKIAASILSSVLTEVVGKITKFIRALMSADKPLEFLGANINKVFSGVLGNAKTLVAWLGSNFIKALKLISSIFEKNLDIDNMGIFGNILPAMKDFITYLAGDATTGIQSFGKSLINLDFSKIATFVMGGILLLFINQLTQLTKSMTGFVDSVTSITTGFAKKLFAPTTQIKDLAFALGVLTASLYVMSKIPWENMKVGLGGLAASLALFIAAYASIQAITVISSKALNGIEVVKSTFNLATMALGVAVMANAISKISSIDETKVWNSLKVIGAMMGLLTAYQVLSALISTIPGQHVISINFASMTFGVLGLVGVVALLDLISPTALKSGLAKLTSSLLVIIGMQLLFSAAAQLGGGHKLALNMLGLAAGLLGLIAVMKILTLIKTSDITAGIKNVFLLGGVIAALELMFAIVARVGKGMKFKSNLFTIELGILGMIAIIKILGTMDPTEIQNGIKTIAMMAGIIGALEILTALAARIGQGNKLQKILGSAALTMLAFTALIAVINIYTPAEINNGLLVISKMMGIIVAFEALSSLAAGLTSTHMGWSSLVSMTTTLLAVTTSLILLSMIPQKDLQNATNALSMAVVAVGIMGLGFGIMVNSLSLINTSLSNIPPIKRILSGLAIVGVMMLATITFFGIFNMVAPLVDSIDWSSMGKFAAGMVFIGGLITAFSLLAMIPGFGNGGLKLTGLVPGLVSLGMVVVATITFFKIMNQNATLLDSVKWQTFDKMIAGMRVIAALIVGMTLLAIPLALLGPGIGPALIGLVGVITALALVIGAFTGAAYLMQSLDSDILIKGLDKLALVGEGIGKFFGSLVGGFSSEIMISFGEGLAGFANAVKDLSGIDFSGIESLAKAFLILTGTAFVEGIARMANWGKSSTAIFGEQVKDLVKVFSEISVTDAVKASLIMIALKPMIENLAILATAAANIPNSGGDLGNLMGENDMGSFGTEIKLFIDALAPIVVGAAEHAGLVIAALKPMVDNLSIVATAAQGIPNAGGFVGDFMGENDINLFGTQLYSFVQSLASINPETQVQPASATLAAMVPMIVNLQKFATLANGLPNSGGMVTWFTGDNDIKTFVRKIMEFTKSLGAMDSANVGKANAIITSMNMYMLPGLERFAALANNLTTVGVRDLPLVPLARDIQGFVNIIKGVDLSVVEPALAALRKINTAFSNLGGKVIASATTSFENNKGPFQNGIATLLNEVVVLVISKQKPIETAFTNIFSTALSQSKKYIQSFKTLGEEIVNGLKSGIYSNANAAQTAMGVMTKNVTGIAYRNFEVDSPSKVFASIGGWLGLGLAKGIKRNSKVAVLASANMASGVEEAVRNGLDVHSESDTQIGIGKWIPESVGIGIERGKKTLLATAKSMGVDTSNMAITSIVKSMASGGDGALTQGFNSLIDLLSSTTNTEAATTVGDKTSNAVVNGLANGLSKGSNKGRIDTGVKAVVESAYEIFKKMIDERKKYHLISLEEELAEWENFSKKYAKGSKLRILADDEVARVKMELDTKSFNNSKTWIDKEKYYKRLGLLDELEAWERVQARYKEGHAFRIEADKELFRIKGELLKAEYQSAIDYMDEEKYYGRLNVVDELKGYKVLQTMYAKGTDERKKIDREVFSLEKDIQNKKEEHEQKITDIKAARDEKRIQAEEAYYAATKEVKNKLANDIKTLTDAYDDAVKSRTQSLYSAWGLFDVVDIKTLSGRGLLETLENQIGAFDNWQSEISMLAEKGISDGLLNELTQMGPKSLSEIKALNTLSGPELDKYVSLWTTKTAEASAQATLELEDMRINTAIQIQQLTIAADQELQNYKTVWDNTLTDINTEADGKLAELDALWLKSMTSLTTASETIVSGFKESFKKEMGELIDNTKLQATEFENLIKRIAGMASDLGNNFDNGLAKGLTGNTKPIVAAATTVGKIAPKVVAKVTKTKSPSRVAIELGGYFVKGFAIGLQSFSGAIKDASMSIGQNAITSISSSMRNISDLVGTPEDEFTIRPILDLSNVKSGMNRLDSLLNKSSRLNLQSNLDLLPSNYPQNTASNPGTQVAESKHKAESLQFIQNNYSPTALSRLDIYRQTKNQFSLMKGVVTAE